MKTILFLYSGAAESIIRLGLQRAVSEYDAVVLSGAGDYELRDIAPALLSSIESKVYRYINFFGASYPTIKKAGIPRWAPGPLDVFPTLPAVRAKVTSGPYLYRFDKWHPWRFATWCRNICKQFPDQAGVFCDDWHTRSDWHVHPTRLSQIWPLYAEGEWAAPYLKNAEVITRPFVALKRQKIMVNGDSRYRAPRLFECFGHWVSPYEVMMEGKPGDALLIRGVAGDRESWLQTTRAAGGYDVGTSYRDVLLDACEIAEKKGMSVGLCLGEKPAEGGSVCNVHRWTDPRTWEEI